MTKMLTPQETLQAIIDGKKLEFKWHNSDKWCAFNPLFNGVAIEHIFKEDYIFRPAQETITIGDVSFPKPGSTPLEKGTKYWVADPSVIYYVLSREWSGDKLDKLALNRGILHQSEENAIAHAKALIKLNGGNVDE